MADTKAKAPVETSSDTPQGRSPRYPFISLDKAVEAAVKLYKAIHKHDVGVLAAFSAMGLHHKSSGTRQTMAALRSFGLVSVVGDGKVRVSDATITLANAAPDSPKIQAALQEAATKPPVFESLWAKFGGFLPTDAAIREYLTIDLGFTPDAAKLIVPRWRATMAYAGLDKLPASQDEKQDNGLDGFDGEHVEIENPQRRGFEKEVRPVRETALDPAAWFPMPVVDDGGHKVVNIPRMSRRAFDRFKQALEFYKDGIVTESEPAARKPPTTVSKEI